MMKPTISRVVVASYGVIAMLLGLAIHLAALAAFDAIILGSAWRSFDRQLALAGSTRWYKSLWRFGVYLVLFSLTAYSLGIAIMDASYGPLAQVPINLLLEMHRYLVAGDMPAAIGSGR